MRKKRKSLNIVVTALLIFSMLCIGGCGNMTVTNSGLVDSSSGPTATSVPTREDIVKIYQEVCETEGRYVERKYIKRLKKLLFPDKNPKEVSDKELEKRYYEIIDGEEKEKIEKSKEPKLIAQNVERIKNNMFLSDGKLYRREPNENVLIYDKPIKDFWSFEESYVIYDADNNVWFYENVSYLKNWYRRSRELKGFYYIPDGQITNELQLAVEGAEKVWVGAKGFAYMKEGRLFYGSWHKKKLMEFVGDNIIKIKDIYFKKLTNTFIMENGDVFVHVPYASKSNELILDKNSDLVYKGNTRDENGDYWAGKYSERYIESHAEYYRRNFIKKDDGTSVLRYIAHDPTVGYYGVNKVVKEKTMKNVKWFESWLDLNWHYTLYNTGDLTKVRVLEQRDKKSDTMSFRKGKNETVIAEKVREFSFLDSDGSLFYVTENGDLYFEGELSNYLGADTWE